MADTKISALTAVTTPADTDEIPCNQGGTTKKLTRAQVLAADYSTYTDWLFAAYDATGTTSITTGGFDLPWDTEQTKHSNYTHTADAAVVTVGAAGLYKVSVDVSVTWSAGGHSTLECHLAESDNTEYAGTRFYVDMIGTLTGYTHSLTAFLTLTAGKTVKVRATGPATAPTTIANGCRFSIERVG